MREPGGIGCAIMLSLVMGVGALLCLKGALSLSAWAVGFLLA